MVLEGCMSSSRLSMVCESEFEGTCVAEIEAWRDSVSCAVLKTRFESRWIRNNEGLAAQLGPRGHNLLSQGQLLHESV